MDPPPRFRVQEKGGVTRIEWRWVGARHALAIVWLPLVCGFWFSWYADRPISGPHAASYVWFLAVTTLFPITSVYFVLAKICNRSRLVVDADSISLRQGPFPWPGSGRWPRAGLVGFVRVASSSTWRGITVNWSTVLAVFDGSQRRRIADDLRDENEALWLTTTLDRRFGRHTGPPVDRDRLPLR